MACGLSVFLGFELQGGCKYVHRSGVLGRGELVLHTGGNGFLGGDMLGRQATGPLAGLLGVATDLLAD